MESSFDTAVVLILFKRTDTTLSLIDVLRKVKPPRLYLVADGPRTEHPGEVEQCLQTRQTVETAINWPCSIQRIYAEHNIGGPQNIIRGLTRVFEQEDMLIMLEDDDLPSPSFLHYADAMLKRYQDASDCFVVLSGDKGLRVPGKDKASYYFSSHPTSLLGIGLWKRSWETMDTRLQHLDEAALKRMRPRFSYPPRFNMLRKTLRSMIAREPGTESWDFTLLYNFYRTPASLCIVASRNLVYNNGLRPDATRTKYNNIFITNPPAQDLDFPLVHPPNMEPIPGIDRLIFNRKHGPLARLGNLLVKLQRLFGDRR